MIDVLIYDAVGAFATRDMVRGGSDLHVTQLAETLAESGLEVVVCRGGREGVVIDRGVIYAPAHRAEDARARAVVLWRASERPAGLKADRFVVHATDLYTHWMDVHAELLASGKARLVAVSWWLAEQFPHARDRVVIPPMLEGLDGPLPEKDEDLFVFASAPWKGLEDSQDLWKRRIAPALSQAHLEVVGVGYGGSPAPSPEAYRRKIAEAAGVFYVNMVPETYCTLAAMAARYKTRFHCLVTGEPSGLAEAADLMYVTSSAYNFVEDFVETYESPPIWLRDPVLPDLTPSGLRPQWLEALFGDPRNPRREIW